MRNEQPVATFLMQAFRRMNMTDAVNEYQVKEAYRSIVGDFINKLTWSVRYDNRTLYIKLASAALKQELSFRRNDLAHRINDQLGRSAVNKIVFM